jgi:hypothetical protein
MRAVEGGRQSGTTSRHPTALYSDLAGRRQQPSARRAALSAAAGPRDSKAHGGALSSVPSPPASPPAELTIARIEPRTSHSAVTNGGEHGEAGPVGTRGCRLDSARGAARRGSARPNRAPQRAQRETASQAACGASRPRPWLLLRSKPASAVATRPHQLLALWTCRRRAMLNRLARDATGMKLLPTTHHRGRACMLVSCVRVCVRLRGPAVASSYREAPAGPEALLPT